MHTVKKKKIDMTDLKIFVPVKNYMSNRVSSVKKAMVKQLDVNKTE